MTKCIIFHNHCNRVHIDFSDGRGRAATMRETFCLHSPFLQFLKLFLHAHGLSLYYQLVTICLLEQFSRLNRTFSQEKTKTNHILLFLCMQRVRHTEFRYAKLLYRTRKLTQVVTNVLLRLDFFTVGVELRVLHAASVGFCGTLDGAAFEFEYEQFPDNACTYCDLDVGFLLYFSLPCPVIGFFFQYSVKLLLKHLYLYVYTCTFFGMKIIWEIFFKNLLKSHLHTNLSF